MLIIKILFADNWQRVLKIFFLFGLFTVYYINGYSRFITLLMIPLSAIFNKLFFYY